MTKSASIKWDWGVLEPNQVQSPGLEVWSEI